MKLYELTVNAKDGAYVYVFDGEPSAEASDNEGLAALCFSGEMVNALFRGEKLVRVERAGLGRVWINPQNCVSWYSRPLSAYELKDTMLPEDVGGAA